MSEETESNILEGGLHVSENVRLQMSSDIFTKKYEHERKKYLLLQDEYKQQILLWDEKLKQINDERL